MQIEKLATETGKFVPKTEIEDDAEHCIRDVDGAAPVEANCSAQWHCKNIQ